MKRILLALALTAALGVIGALTLVLLNAALTLVFSIFGSAGVAVFIVLLVAFALIYSILGDLE